MLHFDILEITHFWVCGAHLKNPMSKELWVFRTPVENNRFVFIKKFQKSKNLDQYH